MELQSVIEKRQSIRKYKPGEVKEYDIREMVRAASLAPSGKNIQNWHFVAIKNPVVMEEIGAAISQKNEEIAARMDVVDAEKAARFRKFCGNFTLFATRAPLLVVVYSTEYTPSGYNELLSVNEPEDTLCGLKLLKNPGMQSLGAAIENFTLRAIDLGYGSCWLTSANYADTEIERVLREKGIFAREGWFMAAMLAVGIPEDAQKSPAKKCVDEILTFVE